MRQETAWGWQKYAKDLVDVHLVAGDHFTMMAKPHVAVLAEELKSCIEQVQSNLQAISQ